MLVIKVWCLPKSTERKLKKVLEDIAKAVEGVRGLDLKDKHSMVVLFPTDMMKYGLGIEIVIEVTGLFIKPEQRDDLVHSRLAECLGWTLKNHFPKAMVECFVFPFDPNQGFWTNPRMGRRRKPTAEDFAKYPPLSPGTQVRTTQENTAMRKEWTEEGRAKRKWGVKGIVITHHDSHGLCYDVKHEDGTEGCYDPSELEIVG